MRHPFAAFVAASLISIHPFITDYYAFGGDHLVLVLGDTFIILAFLLVRRKPTSVLRFAAAVFLVQLGISCYQPKIGLLATLWLLIFFSRLVEWDGTAVFLRRIGRELSISGALILCGAALYFAILKLTQFWFGNPALGNTHAEYRLSMARVADLIPEAQKVMQNTYEILFASDFFGYAFKMLLGMLLVLFLISLSFRIIVRAERPGLKILAPCLLISGICLLPFALHAAYMVSPQSYFAGRFLMPIAYLTAFLPLMLLKMVRRKPALQWPVVGIILFVCCRFVLIDADDGHLARLRTTYEFQFASKLASRIELSLPATPHEHYALVVIGQPPLPALLNPVVDSKSNLNARSFIQFRDVEMLNFFLGRNLLSYPNRDQVNRALRSASHLSIWPEKESIGVEEEIIVVELERPHQNVMTTTAVP
jgi:hypothetical protein